MSSCCRLGDTLLKSSWGRGRTWPSLVRTPAPHPQAGERALGAALQGLWGGCGEGLQREQQSWRPPLG